MFNKPIIQLMSIHFKEFWRQPSTLFWAFGFPIIMAWILGLAFSQKNEISYHAAVIDTSPPASRVLSSICNTKDLENLLQADLKCSYVLNQEEAYQKIRQGKADIIIQQTSKGITLYFDPKNSSAAQTYLYIKNLIYSSQIKGEGEIVIEEKPIESKGNRYIDFLVPGLLALSILNSCLWGTGWSLIELRVKKLLKRLAVTPMKKTDFMLSFGLVRIFIGIVEFILLYGFAYVYFDVIIQGSVYALVLIFLAGNLAFTGIAILAAARANNTKVGNGIVNAVTIPMTIVSGIFFSYHGLPKEFIFLIKLLPLTSLTDSIRSIFNEGAGILEILKPFLILSTEGLVAFALGIKLFKWQ